MIEIAVATLVGAILLALGFCSAMWLSERFKSNAHEERQRAYRDAYIEAQKKIGEDLRKQQETREKFSEFPKDGVEDIQTYEQSLRNLGIPQEKIDKLLAERRKM